MTRVIFKEEDTLEDGQPIGPVTVLSNSEAAAADDGHPLMGRPFRPACMCDSASATGSRARSAAAAQPDPRAVENA